MAEYHGVPDENKPHCSWAGQTCVLGWPVQGIWPPGADGTDVNAVDRSSHGKFLATSDDFGQVRFFLFVCMYVCLFVCLYVRTCVCACVQLFVLLKTCVQSRGKDVY
jgi:hypothetical protein